MSPARITKARKNHADYEIDRIFLGVRIHKRAPSEKLKTAYLKMLDHLKETGNKAVLQSIGRKDNPKDLQDVWIDYKAGKLDTLVTLDGITLASDALKTWLTSAPLRPATQQSYREAVNVLLKDHPKATTERLPQVLQAFRVLCEKADQRTKFRVARAVCLSYASHNGGKHTPLWDAIAGIKLIPAKSDSKESDHKGHAREVVDVVRIVGVMKTLIDAAADKERHGFMLMRTGFTRHDKFFWWMCIAGFRTAELFKYPFELLPDGVRIHGKKNRWSDRTSILIEPMEKPPFKTPDTTNTYLQRAAQILLDAAKDVLASESATAVAKAKATQDVKTFSEHWHLYDGRHSFMHWLEEAGINETRAMKYSGHKPANVHKNYTWHDTGPYREADAELLKTYIKRCLTEGQKPKPVPKPVVEDFLATLTPLV